MPVPADRRPEQLFRVLLVCTGNVCRSAVAERLGRAFLDRTPGEAAAAIRLTSAGTRALAGSAMHPDSAVVLRDLGGESGGFRARQLGPDLVEEADLVLTMTRDHRRVVLEAAPRALGRTFTLREAAALSELLAEDGRAAGGEPAERARAFVRAMAAARPRRRGGDADDVPDPIGRPPEAHREAGRLVEGALVPLLARLVALHRRAPGSDRDCGTGGTDPSSPGTPAPGAG